MKIIFLDIDGVLNCSKTTQMYGGFFGVDPIMMSRLKKVIVETGVDVVLSSSWRNVDNWREEMKLAGCPIPFLDRTPFNKGLTSRGTEIKQWLELNPNVEKFACIDDNTDFLADQKLFKTSWDIGLTDEIAAEMIKYFTE